ncbi:MAG: hypothetical protein KAU21_20310 [Gammaproteobacteria bacterium]|nr:hypothetical protein [Gammaproteobacteria bacterium]
MTCEKDKERELGKNVGLAVQAISNLCKRHKHGSTVVASTNSVLSAINGLPKKRRAIVSKIIIDFAASIKTVTK